MRGLVILILDTLRADYESLCSEYGIGIANLPRLRALCQATPSVACCGSFPTGPMRTDLLTGRLAFLSGDWAIPHPGEETILSLSRQSNIWTTLVSDNYVATLRRLGGMLLDEFDSVDFVRGAGSDPWATPDPALIEKMTDLARRRPTRSARFEAQFIANCRRWPGQVPPFQRAFESACNHLGDLLRHDRFLLWIDTFACHEPWIPAAEVAVGSPLPEEPIFPGYSAASSYSAGDIAAIRRRYVNRIGETDRALGALVGELEAAMSSGDVGCLVLSDHGFLFGEYGFVGKPPNTPLPPELYATICWLSSHFTRSQAFGSAVQPHRLHWLIREVLRLGPNDGIPGGGLRVFARNSPRSDYLAATDGKELYVIQKMTPEPCVNVRTIRLSEADRGRLLMNQGLPEIHRHIRSEIRGIIAHGSSDWLGPFLAAL
jgi:sulfatase-like protein